MAQGNRNGKPELDSMESGKRTVLKRLLLPLVILLVAIGLFSVLVARGPRAM